MYEKIYYDVTKKISGNNCSLEERLIKFAVRKVFREYSAK